MNAQKLFGLFALVASLLVAATAHAAPPADAMQVAVVRSGEPGCEPVCAEWIFAEGQITAETPKLFRQLFTKLGARRLPILLSSQGGSVEAALSIGNMIRERKLDIAIGRTSFLLCSAKEICDANTIKGVRYFGKPDAYGYCYSACPLLFAGGVNRMASPFAGLGVHQTTTTYTKTNVITRETYRMVRGKKKVISRKVVRREQAGTYQQFEMNRATERKLKAYVKKMGVDAGLVDAMKLAGPSDIHLLSADERLKFKLVDPARSVVVLVGAHACKIMPAPGNCRLVTVDDLEPIKPAKPEPAKAEPAKTRAAKSKQTASN